MSDLSLWERHGEEFGWKMPIAPTWKRLLIIRHVRALWASYQVERHNALWRSMGSIPSGYDSWVVFGIWHGKERGDV